MYREKDKDVATVISSWSNKYGPMNRWNNKYYKGELQVLNLLKEKYNFFKFGWEDFGVDFPKSVDGMHFDETYHEKIAKEFYKLVKN